MNVSKSNKLTKLQNDEIKLNILFNKVFPQISIDKYDYYVKNKMILDLFINQYLERINEQLETSLNYEKKQQEYLKDKKINNGKLKYKRSIEKTSKIKENLLDILKNEEDIENDEIEEEIIELSYSNVKYMKKFSQDIKQDMLRNKTFTRDKGQEASFFTMTLPSRFHPFITAKFDKKTKKNIKLHYEKWTLNLNFQFSSIDEGIRSGYSYLNDMTKDLLDKIKYGNLKYRKILKDTKYNIIFEPHKSLIPHVHGIIYYNLEVKKIIEKSFKTIIKKYDLDKRFNEMKFNWWSGWCC